MTQTVPLAVTGTVMLNGSGSGVIQLGPSFGQVWNPTAVSISSAGNVPTGSIPATCSISVGANASGAVFVDSTYQVLGAASSLISGQVIPCGSYVFVVFANANQNVLASATINGTMNVWG